MRTLVIEDGSAVTHTIARAVEPIICKTSGECVEESAAITVHCDKCRHVFCNYQRFAVSIHCYNVPSRPLASIDGIAHVVVVLLLPFPANRWDNLVKNCEQGVLIANERLSCTRSFELVQKRIAREGSISVLKEKLQVLDDDTRDRQPDMRRIVHCLGFLAVAEKRVDEGWCAT